MRLGALIEAIHIADFDLLGRLQLDSPTRKGAAGGT